ERERGGSRSLLESRHNGVAARAGASCSARVRRARGGGGAGRRPGALADSLPRLVAADGGGPRDHEKRFRSRRAAVEEDRGFQGRAYTEGFQGRRRRAIRS